MAFLYHEHMGKVFGKQSNCGNRTRQSRFGSLSSQVGGFRAAYPTTSSFVPNNGGDWDFADAPAQTFQNYSRSYYEQRLNSSRNRCKRRLWSIVLALALLVLLVCLIILGAFAWSYYSGARLYDEVAQGASVVTEANALAEMTVDWDALLAQNPDTVAWIYMPDTPIDYPIVQGEDDDEYLHVDFEGNYSLVSIGSIFLSASNSSDFSDDISYIYGHRLNSGGMFGSLLYLQDQDTFDEVRTLYILTPTRNYRCTTIALDIVANTETSIIQPNFTDSATMISYLQEHIDSATTKADNIDLTSISKAFALITCGNTNATTRAVLYAGVTETAVPSNADTSTDDSEEQSSQSDESSEDDEIVINDAGVE